MSVYNDSSFNKLFISLWNKIIFDAFFDAISIYSQ